MRLIDADELRNHWLHDTIGNNPEFTPNDVLDSIDECPTIEPNKMTVKQLLTTLDPLVYIEMKCQDGSGLTVTKYRGKAEKLPKQYLYWEVCGVTTEMNKMIIYTE